jgi:hypothetical protein
MIYLRGGRYIKGYWAMTVAGSQLYFYSPSAGGLTYD